MRKIPTQDRAQRTVGYILDAAAYILEQHGLAGFTTNKVADKAGVNIASLYQYFNNKAAFLKALQVRHVNKPDPAGDWQTHLADLPLGDLLRQLVAGALAEHSENKGVHRIILTTVPRNERAAVPAEARMAQITALLAPKARPTPHTAMMMFIARHALLGVIDEAICERPEWLGDPTFAEELTGMLEGYLAGE